MVATFKAKRDAAYEHGRVLRWFWAAHVGVEPEAIRLQRKSNSNQLNGRSWRSVHGVRTRDRQRHLSARAGSSLDRLG